MPLSASRARAPTGQRLVAREFERERPEEKLVRKRAGQAAPSTAAWSLWRIAKHSEEHLASTNRGLVMLRRLLQKQLDAVKQGRDPAGVFFDPATPPVKFGAGNWVEAS